MNDVYSAAFLVFFAAGFLAVFLVAGFLVVFFVLVAAFFLGA